MPNGSHRQCCARAARSIATGAAIAAIVAGCGQAQQPAAGPPAMPPAEVTAIVVQPKPIPVTFEYVGQALGSKEVEVRARVGGILEKRLFQEGAPVKAGQVLFVIDPKPYEAQLASADAELARAQAQLSQAVREAARLKPLAEKKAIGQKEYDDAVSTGELAAASVKSMQAKVRENQLNLGYTRVVAPISGFTSRATKSEGSLVSVGADSLLTVISQTDPIWVQFNISENQKLRIDRAIAEKKLEWPRNGRIDVRVQLADGALLDRHGRINFNDTRINTATGTYESRAEFPNRDNVLKPGQFLRVILNGAVRRDAVAVPQSAVLDGPQGKFVYVAASKDGKQVASVKPVTLGDWITAGESNLWIVESGLAQGDQVIVDGIAKLMPGAPIKLAQAAPAGGAAASAPPSGAANAPVSGAIKSAPAGASSEPRK